MESERSHDNGTKDVPEKTNIWKTYQGGFRKEHLNFFIKSCNRNCFSEGLGYDGQSSK